MNAQFCRGIMERILTVPNVTIGLLGWTNQGKDNVGICPFGNMD